MKRPNRKGFTIVELVIVIAIIAILAAVLIPTFVYLINQANQSNDMVLVTEINRAIQMYEAANNFEDVDVNTALKIAEEHGFSLPKMSPLSDGNVIVWDDAAGINRFELVTPDATTGRITAWLEYDEAKGYSDADSDKLYWIFSSDINCAKYDKYNYMHPLDADSLDSEGFWDTVNGNAQVVLFDDWTKDLTIPAVEGYTPGEPLREVSISLNGRTIANKTATGSTIVVEAGNKLTIDGEGSIQSMQQGKAVIYVEQYAEVVLNGGSLTRENYGDGSWYTVFNQGTMTINEGVSIEVPAEVDAASSLIRNGTLENEGAISATLTINGGTFVASGSNVVKNEYGTVIINDGTFINNYIDVNTADKYPSRQVLQTYDKMIINGGKFVANNDTEMVGLNVNEEITSFELAPVLEVNGGDFASNKPNTDNSYGKYFFYSDDGASITVTGGTFTGGDLYNNVKPTVVRATFNNTSIRYLTPAEGSVLICTDDLDGNEGDIICPESELSNYEVAGWRDDKYFLCADKVIIAKGGTENKLIYLNKTPSATLDIKVSYLSQYVIYLAEGVDAGKLNFVDSSKVSSYYYKPVVVEMESDKPEYAKKLVVNGSVTEAEGVAYIERSGSKIYYGRVYDAGKAVDNETIVITGDIALKTGATFNDNATVDLNGYTLSKKFIKASDCQITFKNGAMSCELRGDGDCLITFENVTFTGTITSGRFLIDPTAYLTEGSTVEIQPDGTYKVVAE